MKFKGKYKGNKHVELEEELNLPTGTEISFVIENISRPEKKIKSSKIKKNDAEHPFKRIAKRAINFGRSDLSEKHHEILGELIE